MPSSELSELSKLRVCFLTHNLRQDNGAGVFSRRLIDGLKTELGIEPVVFTSEEYPKLFWKIFTIRREIKKCDVVHALDGYPYGVIAYLASFGLGKKLIITAVGSGAIIYLYKPIYSFLLKRAYRVADKVIAVSKFTRDEILKKVPNLAIVVINHGVDYQKFESRDFLSTSGGEVSIVSFKPYILSVGSLRWRKGYHRSIEAFAKVAEIFPDLKYVIVGKQYDGVYYERLYKLISDLKLNGKVIILDNVDDESDLIQSYQNAELFGLMPQTAHRDLEGFGLVFLEAAAAGLPVVGTFDSGVEDAILDGKNGFLVGPRNVERFADVVIKILQSPGTKARMSKESLELARRSGWGGKVAEYVSIYKNLNKPKIVYVTNARLPTEKAHGLATVKMAEAFADLGYRVDLVVPRRWQKVHDIFDHYNLRRNFRIKKLPTLDLLGNPIAKWFEKPIFWLQLFSFSIAATIYCFLKYRTWRPSRQAVFFSHDHVPLWFLSRLGARIFYDIHHFPDHNMFYERVLKKSVGIAVQTQWKTGALKGQFGIDPTKVVYWPNGTDIQKFQITKSKLQTRETLGLPQGKKIVVYTGQLFDWKGVETLILAGEILESQNVEIYIVGGSESQIRNRLLRRSSCEGQAKSEIRNKSQMPIPKNIKFTGFRPHSEIPFWLCAADVLVLPNTGKQKVSLYYTSPMKMFEYMASGTPIVASRIPSISEILSDQNAFLAEADNPDDFAKQIGLALRDGQEAAARARKSLKDVGKYTWAERARKLGERLAV